MLDRILYTSTHYPANYAFIPRTYGDDNDPTYNQYTDINQLPSHVFDEMRHFFTVYKNLENKTTAVNEVSGREEAVKIITKAIESYIDHFCK